MRRARLRREEIERTENPDTPARERMAHIGGDHCNRTRGLRVDVARDRWPSSASAIMVDQAHANARWPTTAPVIIFLDVAALFAVWRQRSSILDLWLLVALWAWLIETLLLSSTNYRYSLVWYCGRAYGLISSSVVLVVLLSQTTALHAKLAVSVLKQRRERENRLVAIDTTLAAIAHEIKQRSPPSYRTHGPGFCSSSAPDSAPATFAKSSMTSLPTATARAT